MPHSNNNPVGVSSNGGGCGRQRGVRSALLNSNASSSLVWWARIPTFLFFIGVEWAENEQEQPNEGGF